MQSKSPKNIRLSGLLWRAIIADAKCQPNPIATGSGNEQIGILRELIGAEVDWIENLIESRELCLNLLGPPGPSGSGGNGMAMTRISLPAGSFRQV